jgi:hypothetical protein
MENTGEMWNKLKASSKVILPTTFEFIVFLIIVLLFFLVIALFHHSSIQKLVRKTSRCLADKSKYRVAGKYTVTATTAKNEPLYTVGYDFNAKTTSVECACKEGETVNTFRNIDTYNLRTRQPEMISQKACSCDSFLLEPGQKVYYNGYPGLVRYMNSGDTTFFDVDPTMPQTM